MSQALTRRHQYIHTHRFCAPFQEKATALIELGSLNLSFDCNRTFSCTYDSSDQDNKQKPMLKEVQNWSYDTEFLKHSGIMYVLSFI